MLDTAAMSQQLASFLAPLLPYLTGVKNEPGWELGADVWDKATAMWTRLGPKIEAKESAMEVAHDASQTPEDADALAAFRFQLKKLLAEDAALAEELAELLQSSQPTSGHGGRMEDQSVLIGGATNPGGPGSLGAPSNPGNPGNHGWIITGNWNVVNSRANDK